MRSMVMSFPKNAETLESLDSLSPNIQELTSVVDRPPFKNHYIFSILFSLDINYFFKFEDHKEFFTALIRKKDAYLQTDPRLLNFYIFTSDLKFMLDILKTHEEDLFEANELRLYDIKIISDNNLGKKITPKLRRRPKKPWYNVFPYRVRFKSELVQVEGQIGETLEKFNVKYLWNTNHQSLLYVVELNDIFLLKLLHSSIISEIISFNQEHMLHDS